MSTAADPAGAVFASVFEAMRQSVKTAAPLNLHVERAANAPRVSAGDLFMVTSCGFARDLPAQTARIIRDDAGAELRRLAAQARVRRSQHEAVLAALKAQRTAFRALTSRTIAHASLRDSLFRARTKQASESSTRRLQELLFECLGELQKAYERANLRSCSFAKSAEDEVQGADEDLLWRRFLLRAQEDTQGALQLSQASATTDAELFDRLCFALDPVLGARLGLPEGARAQVSRVIMVRYRNVGPGARVRRSRDPNAVPAAAETAVELMALFDRLHSSSMARGRRQSVDNGAGQPPPAEERPATPLHHGYQRHLPSGARRLPLFDARMLLSSKVTSWVASGFGERGSVPINSCLYYCLEEHFLGQCSNGGVAAGAAALAAAATAANAGGEEADDDDRGDGVESARLAAALAAELENLYCVPDATGDPEFMELVSTLFSSGGLGRHQTRWEVSAVEAHHRGPRAAATPPLAPGVARRLASLPDIVVADVTVGERPLRLHFAPASVLQLLETTAFATLSSRLPAADLVELQARYPPELVRRSTLSQLYSPYGSDAAAENPLLAGAALRPVSQRCVEELVTVFVVRNSPKTSGSSSSSSASTFTMPTAQCVFPDSRRAAAASTPRSREAVLPARFCLVQSPALEVPETLDRPAEEITYGDPHGDLGPVMALVVRFQEVDAAEVPLAAQGAAQQGSSSQGGTKKKKRTFDAALLGGFCQWRSCLAPATPTPLPKTLCEHHSAVKALMDRRSGSSGKSSESARFLPKRPPASSSRAPEGTAAGDLASIRAASSLLQELLSGKLGATIASFCKRAAADTSERVKAERAAAKASRSSTKAPRAPKSAAELRAEKAAYASAKDYAQRVAATERAVTDELRRLCELGVYPTAELALIRREYKVLEGRRLRGAGGDDDDGGEESGTARSDAELELQFCERKRTLLYQRRQEVEATAVATASHPPVRFDERGYPLPVQQPQDDQPPELMFAPRQVAKGPRRSRKSSVPYGGGGDEAPPPRRRSMPRRR